MLRKIPFLGSAIALIMFSLFIVGCPEDDENNCIDMTGIWDFVVIETWDCDGIAESEPYYGDERHINQVDCDISFTGTFRKDLSGIMTGTIEENSFSITYFDPDVSCSVTISGTVNDEADHLTGTWEDDCYDSADGCNGERGTFTAIKQSGSD